MVFFQAAYLSYLSSPHSIDTQIDSVKQIDRENYGYIDRQIDIVKYVDIQMDRQIDREIYGYIDRWIDR